MTCRMQAARPRDCKELCDDCVCDLTAKAPLPADLLAHAKEGAPVEVLIDLARGITMTPEQAEAQRRSFAFGNTALSNPNVTRRIVDEAADRERRGDWMQTFTGRQYWPADPRPEDVDVRDIAHALSLQCRYGGHAVKFYSVAEHCVLMARVRGTCFAGERMALLMHDASEAYLVDVPRPVKPQLQGYSAIEDRNMRAIAQRFGFTWPMPAIVKWADNAILHDERAQVMAPCAADWNLPGEPLGVQIPFWPPAIAEAEFLRAFADFGGVA